MYQEKGYLDTYTNWRAFDVRKEIARTIYNRVKSREETNYDEKSWNTIKKDEIQKLYALIQTMDMYLTDEKTFLEIACKEKEK